MAKTVFVSIGHEDKKDIIHQLKEWKRQNLIQPIDFQFEEEDLRQKGEAEVTKYLTALLDRSQVVVFVIGQDTHNRPWIEWEYNYAQNKGKKLEYFRTEDSKGAPNRLMGKVDPLDFTLENFNKAV